MTYDGFDFVAKIKGSASSKKGNSGAFTIWRNGEVYFDWQKKLSGRMRVSTIEWLVVYQAIMRTPKDGSLLVLTHNENIVKIIAGAYQAHTNLQWVEKVKGAISGRPGKTEIKLY